MLTVKIVESVRILVQWMKKLTHRLQTDLDWFPISDSQTCFHIWIGFSRGRSMGLVKSSEFRFIIELAPTGSPAAG